MKNQIFILLLLAIFNFNCSSDGDSMEGSKDEPVAEPLTVVSVNGFVSTGPGTFQVTNLLGSSNTIDVQTTSPFIVTFSKSVKTYESLINMVRLDNGSAVEGVPITITKQSDTELQIEPVNPLVGGTQYTLNLNAGIVASDDTSLESLAQATFTTEGTVPEALQISSVIGTVFNGSGFEGVDLIANYPVTEVTKNSEFTVIFSKALAEEFKTDDQYLDLNRMENGTAVEDIPIILSSVVDSELIITPNADLVYGTTYQLYFTPDYKSTDGGLLGEVITVEFTVRTPDPLSVSSIVANGSNAGGNVSTDILANSNSTGIPVNSTFTATFSQTVIASANNADFIQLTNSGTSEVIGVTLSEDLQNSTITITPDASLAPSTQYQIKIAQGTVDSVDGQLENDVVVSFTTEN